MAFFGLFKSELDIKIEKFQKAFAPVLEHYSYEIANAEEFLNSDRKTLLLVALRTIMELRPTESGMAQIMKKLNQLDSANIGGPERSGVKLGTLYVWAAYEVFSSGLNSVSVPFGHLTGHFLRLTDSVGLPPIGYAFNVAEFLSMQKKYLAANGHLLL